MRPYAVIQPTASPQPSPAAGAGGTGSNTSTSSVIVITVPANELPLRIGGFIGGILLGIMLAAGIIAGARFYWKRNHEGTGSAKVAQQPDCDHDAASGAARAHHDGTSGNLKLQAGSGVSVSVSDSTTAASAKLHPLGDPAPARSHTGPSPLSRGGDISAPPPPQSQLPQSSGPPSRSPGLGSPYAQTAGPASRSTYGSPIHLAARLSSSRGGSPALGPAPGPGSPSRYSAGSGSPSPFALPPSMPLPMPTPASMRSASPMASSVGGPASHSGGHSISISASSQSYPAGPSGGNGGLVAVHARGAQASSASASGSAGLPPSMRYQPCPVDTTGAGSLSSNGSRRDRDGARPPLGYGYSSPGPVAY